METLRNDDPINEGTSCDILVDIEDKSVPPVAIPVGNMTTATFRVDTPLGTEVIAETDAKPFIDANGLFSRPFSGAENGIFDDDSRSKGFEDHIITFEIHTNTSPVLDLTQEASIVIRNMKFKS